jgi:protein-tyrosine phosphatase
MDKKRVLFVCLGNICRSPTAEGVIRAIAASEYPELALSAASAGTANYHVGEPPDRRTVAAARRRGYDLSAQRAREICPDDYERFDYVLAMDRANLAVLERQRPHGAMAAVGLFLDFAPGSGFLEVPDPYYGGAEEFERVLDLCEAGAHGLLRKLSNRE